jgi:hypothetical protein
LENKIQEERKKEGRERERKREKVMVTGKIS